MTNSEITEAHRQRLAALVADQKPNERLADVFRRQDRQRKNLESLFVVLKWGFVVTFVGGLIGLVLTRGF